MTVWLDAGTGIVLAAQRTTADGIVWDSFEVLSIDFDAPISTDTLQCTPPADGVVVTDPDP